MFPGFEAAKAYVALVGAIATALLGVYTSDTPVGQVLTVLAVVATAFGTWAVQNSPKRNEHGQASVLHVLLIVLVVLVILALVGAL